MLTDEQANILQEYYRSIDSKEKELSEAQKHYFKDSVVRDEKGRLMVVYHGSPSQFKEFLAQMKSQTSCLGGKTNSRLCSTRLSESLWRI